MLAVAGAVFVSFGGLTATADIAGEVHRAGRTLPAGMLSALVVVSVFYVAVVFVTVGVSDPAELSGSLTPLADAAGRMIGPVGTAVLTGAAALAFVTTANGGLLESSRSPVAMSRDGLLPSFLQTHSRRFGTPVVSVLLTSGAMVIVIAALSIENLVKVASTMLLVLYTLICLSVIIMRTSRIQNYRPTFRAPLVPWLPLAGILLYAFLIADMGWIPLTTTAAFAIAGGLWWLVYVRHTQRRESALAYLVKNIVAREMRRSHLEEELKQIAFQRDQVQQDRFDRVVQRCDVLDLPASVHSGTEMLNRAAAALARRTDMDADGLGEKFLARERESSTVLQPGLAVPHVVVDGENVFEMVLVRSRDGLQMTGTETPVRIAFVLVGSSDQRNFHLRALMAIAHVVQEENFVQRFLAAEHPEQLRDLLLLSNRKRQAAEA
jgi:mannitol/fructose-specific phosphotransferase system IIA component (Ntr-type)